MIDWKKYRQMTDALADFPELCPRHRATLREIRIDGYTTDDRATLDALVAKGVFVTYWRYANLAANCLRPAYKVEFTPDWESRV